MTGFLASVDNLEDAISVSEYGADIIDLKDPHNGALGALPISIIQNIVDHLWEKSVISATVGDLEADVSIILEKIGLVADTGVDYVKVGMFSQAHIEQCLPSFEYHARRGVHIIAVLFADVKHDTEMAIAYCKKARIAGVMMDTAGKGAGSLLQHRNIKELSNFVQLAKKNRLLSGLAGSLRQQDIPTLSPIAPDYLGFRTALCQGTQRTAGIDIHAVRQVRNQLPRQLSATVRLG